MTCLHPTVFFYTRNSLLYYFVSSELREIAPIASIQWLVGTDSWHYLPGSSKSGLLSEGARKAGRAVPSLARTQSHSTWRRRAEQVWLWWPQTQATRALGKWEKTLQFLWAHMVSVPSLYKEPRKSTVLAQRRLSNCIKRILLALVCCCEISSMK